AELSALDHSRADLLPVRRFDPELDEPVGQEQAVARFDTSRQPFERCRNPPGATHEITGSDAERIADLQLQRASILQETSADFGSAEVLKNGHFAPGASRSRPHARKRRTVRLV